MSSALRVVPVRSVPRNAQELLQGLGHDVKGVLVERSEWAWALRSEVVPGACNYIKAQNAKHSRGTLGMFHMQKVTYGARAASNTASRSLISTQMFCTRASGSPPKRVANAAGLVALASLSAS